ncbi:hypothetical protein QQF64_004149 [Cirrhinus molitorella]|uniref:Secreted protein n=1 Tax=Cirrhinus molitorella TaxID=172907 RepID=A0ABR3MFB2_9TELE
MTLQLVKAEVVCVCVWCVCNAERHIHACDQPRASRSHCSGASLSFDSEHRYRQTLALLLTCRAEKPASAQPESPRKGTDAVFNGWWRAVMRKSTRRKRITQVTPVPTRAEEGGTESTT